MIAVWVYSYDGRAQFCVCVATPLPPAVVCAGVTYTWDASHEQYRSSRPTQGIEGAQEVTREVPQGERP